MKEWGKKLFLLTALCMILSVGCETEPQARNAVLDFVRELRTDKDFELEKYLALQELVKENVPTVYIYDSTLSISENIDRFKDLFEPEGRIRNLWVSKQIVVGESEVLGDTAYVEVSFIDKDTRKHYYNKMGLRRTEEGWIIFAFKLL